MINIDKEKCIKCGLCINDCMPRVIRFDEEGFPTAARPDGCIKCQHCLAICPVGALTYLDKKPENSEQIKKHNPDEILSLIKDRRSFRSYKNENVDTETMKKLKNMLNWVPTGVNNHKLHFSFIDDLEVMNNFRNQTNKLLLDGIKKNPERFARFRRYSAAILRGQDVIFRGAPHMIIVAVDEKAPCANIDPVIALSYFELYAQSLNLGTCWCGLGFWVFEMFPELLERLNIPKGYNLAYTMLFGPKGVNYKRSTQPEPYSIVSVK